MTPEQQRIAIAGACGWKDADHPEVMVQKFGWTKPESWCMNPKGDICFIHDRPDYLNDLNAMAEAENCIPNELEGEYWKNLRGLNLGKRIYYFTAAQRAEAFLKTLGLWEEAL